MTWITQSNPDYHNWKNSWGSTMARLMLTSPRLARDIVDRIVPGPSSSALGLGTAWHARITNDGDKGIVRPDGLDGRSKEGKAWLDEHKKRIVLTPEQDQHLGLMAERMPGCIRNRIDRWMTEGLVEVVARTPNLHGYTRQARPDIVSNRDGVIVDLKTTGKSIEEFSRSALNYGYPFQAGWYRRVISEAIDAGGNMRPVILVVTETFSPFRTVMFYPDSSWLTYGDAQAAQAEKRLEYAYLTNSWTDTTDPVQPLALPKWAGTTTGETMPAFEG